MTQQNDNEFQNAYSLLNAAQKRAVDTIDGPVMVIAGPGTGKTQVLTLRIVNILRTTDTAPESILALTFTKSGARAMRERLRTFVGALAYRIPIYTFHSFCEQLISQYPEYYKHIIGGRPVSEIERIRFIEQILDSPELQALRPMGAPDYYIYELLSIISSMKQENIFPDDLAKIIATETEALDEIERFHIKGPHKGKERADYKKTVEKIEKQKLLLVVYRHYIALMQAERRYDFDDMIIETIRVLESVPSVLLDVQEQYQYILADEHQDVNGAQNKILSLLSSFHASPNLFVVGDEKQSIYRFQGASLDNFLYFENTFPQTTVIALTENYRSTQNILDTAHELIKVTEGPLLDYRVPLTACGYEKDGVVSIYQYAHEHYEHQAILRRIQKAIQDNVPPSEIAVIVRSNREVESITTFLRANGIAVAPSADGDILQSPVFQAINNLLTVIAEPNNREALFVFIQSPYSGILPDDAALLLRSVSYAVPITSLFYDPEKRNSIAFRQPDTISNVSELILQLRSRQVTEPAHRILAAAVSETLFLESAVGSNMREATRIVRRLYDEVEQLYVSRVITDLHSLLLLLRQRMQYGVALEAPFIPDGIEAIQVMTVHKSKGLEFSMVFLPHLTDKDWSAKKRKDIFKVPLLKTEALRLEANEDDRRLLYVAMTRAKTTLYLSYSKMGISGREASISPLLYDVTGKVSLEIVPEEATALENHFSIHKVPSVEIVKMILTTALTRQGLSVTGLNNLMSNPWNYFFRNALRIPQLKTPAQHYGTAMHDVMQFLTSRHTRDKVLPSFSEARSRLQFSLEQLPLSSTEFSDLFEKGIACLPTHLDNFAVSLPAYTREEKSLRVIIEPKHPYLNTLTLTGILDRIDSTEGGDVLRVIDYKTGKIKSRNEIEGTTKKSEGSYRRQLCFYALLLRLYEEERLYTPIGTIQFIEPDKKGRVREETFESEVHLQNELLDTINEVIATLLEVTFISDDDLLEKSNYVYLAKLWRDRMYYL
jgi:DNA helicase II / ATP-dependent DNA helicase PcrA